MDGSSCVVEWATGRRNIANGTVPLLIVGDLLGQAFQSLLLLQCGSNLIEILVECTAMALLQHTTYTNLADLAKNFKKTQDRAS